MNRFIKSFMISLISFSLIALIGMTAYSKIFESHSLPIPQGQVDKLDLDHGNPFEKSVLEGKRLNTLIVGVNDNMTDTIILSSFNIETKDIDMISIPRDTYHERKGHEGAAERKINSIYKDEGMETLIDNVQDLLGEKIPIHHYVVAEYEGVAKMVDVVGGVKVDVPINMKYDDPYSDPPLKIRIKKGEQVLDGEEAIDFLRFRKNNDGPGYINGDLGRIESQQQFIKSFLKKALGPKLLSVTKTGLSYVDTDIKMSQGLSYASRLLGVSSDKVNMIMLPGIDEYIGDTSYYIQDEEATHQLIKDMYHTTKTDDDFEFDEMSKLGNTKMMMSIYK